MPKDKITQALIQLSNKRQQPQAPLPLETRVLILEQRMTQIETKLNLIGYLLLVNTSLVVFSDTPRIIEIIKTLFGITLIK